MKIAKWVSHQFKIHLPHEAPHKTLQLTLNIFFYELLSKRSQMDIISYTPLQLQHYIVYLYSIL